MPNEILWTVFGYVDSHWGTDTAMSRAQFEQALASQVTLDSSYQQLYQETEAAYQTELAQRGSVEAVLQALYSNNAQPNPAQPDVAKVLEEFIRWNVAFGGFRSFGYENYPGWSGNGSFLKQPPPYRTAP